ncbi:MULTISPECIES: glucose-1-phosphate adenylyltransferase [Kocuria]|jgi:glucose-1-phosphate adenylyltransferase|uniref:glucose-1-phosphate adenylyltransferase n=1 Tax=Kocuria TaxID=57493 RepID=UPI00203C67E2|nr:MULTISPECIES: glucose-1-phosphate adenylyltransferase [Kocuria]MCM3687487.1 glucose-1-phosphate adenylyltransferase [Kocuria rosea]HST73384.1 glucose-1-phosphate adenylyltransferase [Kocuria rosea]
MPHRKKVLAIVLAGGEGKRLMPLTEDRAKPAVPFGGSYRLIDFALSNLVNSGYLQIVVLTQYKSHSLDRHVSETWRLSTQLGNYVTTVPAQQRRGKDWYLGSANAIYQSLNLVDDARPDIVVVVGADHVYRMDFSAMVDFHVQSGARATVAGVRQPMEMVTSFGVIETDPNDPTRITRFVEKPQSTAPLPDDPNAFYASMGNYVFDTDALVEALRVDESKDDTDHDMGGDIMPWFADRGEAAVYDFTGNDVPGSTDRDRQYWRDVGTLDSYYDSHLDLIRPLPVFNLYNYSWPIYTYGVQAPPAKLVRGPHGEGGVATDSILSAGVLITGGRVHESVLSPKVLVQNDATVSQSVLMDNVWVGEGAVVDRCILDKNVVVPPGTRVGVDREEDKARGLTVTTSGLTVAPKNYRFEL